MQENHEEGSQKEESKSVFEQDFGQTDSDWHFKGQKVWGGRYWGVLQEYGHWPN